MDDNRHRLDSSFSKHDDGHCHKCGGDVRKQSEPSPFNPVASPVLANQSGLVAPGPVPAKEMTISLGLAMFWKETASNPDAVGEGRSFKACN